MLRRDHAKLILAFFLTLALSLTACGNSALAAGSVQNVSEPARDRSASRQGISEALQGLFGSGSDSSDSSDSSDALDADLPERPSTPVIYTPEAPGETVIGAAPLIIDVSNAAQGYVMALYNGDAVKANIQLTGPDGITYKYFLPSSESYVPLPLTGGSGAYTIEAYENVVDNKYAALFKEAADFTLESELLPYLYPNQYVNFSADTEAVSVAEETVEGVLSDLQAVAQIYHYVVENVSYDEEKAATVASGYLPVVDETLHTGKGICFDYAALTAAMLRSQDIPTRLEIGYSGDVYHCWISVYIDDVGWIDKLIEFTGDDWTRMDPTFASSNESSSAVLEYIGDGSNYTLQYLH